LYVTIHDKCDGSGDTKDDKHADHDGDLYLHTPGYFSPLLPKQIFPILFAFCYIIFSIIYVLGSGAQPNYTVLTWTNGSSVLYSFLALLLIIIW
jgi:hypothetical protein